MTSLVIGTGYIGTQVAEALRQHGAAVTQSSRTAGSADILLRDGAALDDLLADTEFHQIVAVGQLTRPDIDWLIERVDGPRWVVLSSNQVTATVASPGVAVALAREEVALAGGACVLRPTMVYGRGGDQNISRLIRFMQRWRLAAVPGSGSQLVQPVHIDDLAALIVRHLVSPAAGIFAVGGDETLPIRELVATMAELIGIRLPVVECPSAVLSTVSRLSSLFGLRPDQIERLMEDKVAQSTSVRETFGWEPAPLGLRLEQAVREVVIGSTLVTPPSVEASLG